MMAIEFKYYGYRIDVFDNVLFLGVIFTDNWIVCFRPHVNDDQKEQILAKMKELQNEKIC